MDDHEISFIHYTAKVLCCWDGVARDVHVTQDSGKRAMLMHLLLHDEEPFDAQGNPKNASIKSTMDALKVVFASGFLSEVSAIGVNLSYLRPNSYQSGNGAVLEIHAVDAACFYHRAREMTMNSLHLFGLDCAEGGSMHFAALSKDALVNRVGLPQMEIWRINFKSHVDNGTKYLSTIYQLVQGWLATKKR